MLRSAMIAGPACVLMRTERSVTWSAFLMTRPVLGDDVEVGEGDVVEPRLLQPQHRARARSAVPVIPEMWTLRTRGVRSDTGSGGAAV